MTDDRRELGGEFPKLAPDELDALAGPTIRELYPRGTLLGTGRAALLSLWEHGRATRGWQRLLVPRYLCREVPDALAAVRVPVALYEDHPLLPTFPDVETRAGDVLLRVFYFGWRGPAGSAPVDVIEDHTHDPAGPAARASRAAFAFASLRKTMPVTDGAVLWSPAGHEVPAPPPATSAHLAACELKQRGMEAKRQWLLGRGGRSEHVTWLAAGERHLARGGASGASPDALAVLVRVSPVVLAERRRAAVARVPVPARWRPAFAPPPGGSPFALVLDLGPERDRVQRALHASRVYSQALWPLPWAWPLTAGARLRAVSRRLLATACDFRASEADLERLGHLLATLAG